MNCIFCQIASGEADANIIYRDEQLTCFLDYDPINEGHVLIVPNRHYLDADEIPDETLAAIMLLAKRIVRAIKERYSPDGYSIMQNGGLFNDVGHYHLHVFPRYKGDGFGWTIGDGKHKASPEVANVLKEMLVQGSKS